MPKANARAAGLLLILVAILYWHTPVMQAMGVCLYYGWIIAQIVVAMILVCLIGIVVIFVAIPVIGLAAIFGDIFRR